MLITLIVSLVVISIILYFVESVVTIDVRLKQLIYALIALYVVAWLLAAFGVSVPILSPLLLR